MIIKIKFIFALTMLFFLNFPIAVSADANMIDIKLGILEKSALFFENLNIKNRGNSENIILLDDRNFNLVQYRRNRLYCEVFGITKLFLSDIVSISWRCGKYKLNTTSDLAKFRNDKIVMITQDAPEVFIQRPRYPDIDVPK